MNWLLFALLAPALDTLINFTDKYIIEREVTDYRGMPIYGTIVGLVVGTIYWIATGFPQLHPRDAALIIFTGMLSIWGLALYFKALTLEETSRIIVFFKAIPIFILGLSYLFLKETINLQQLLGFILILIAVLGVSKPSETNKLKSNFFSSALGLILLVDIIWAIAAILVKFTIQQNSFSKIISYESWGVGLGGLILYIFFPSIRNAFHNTLRTVRKRALMIMFINESIFVFSRAVTFYAYSLGPTALVSVIGTTQVFYGILYGYTLTNIAPKIFQENIQNKVITQKLIFALILIIGIYLVS